MKMLDPETLDPGPQSPGIILCRRIMRLTVRSIPVIFVAFLLLVTFVSHQVAAAELDDPVVIVNGETITLRALEDELLRKEGVEEAQALVDEFLARIDWSKLSDDDVIVTIAGQDLTRLDLAAYLLREKGAEVRKELIHITLVRQALTEAGLAVTDELLAAEYERQERRFSEKMAAAGETQVAFADYLRIKEGKTVQAWMAEEGFRMAAALHELVHRKVDPPKELLLQFFKQEYDKRYAKPAGLRLSVITRTWPMVKVGDQEVVDQGRKEGMLATMRRLGQDLQGGKISFPQAWRLWGKPFDPQSVDGDVGWVTRDGTTERSGARAIPGDVMDLAWDLAWGGTMDVGKPILLPPMAHEAGIDLVRIEARREAQRPTFEAIADQVQYDYVETRLEEFTAAYMERLAIEAEVEYQSLTELMTQRLQAAGQEVAPVDEP